MKTTTAPAVQTRPQGAAEGLLHRGEAPGQRHRSVGSCAQQKERQVVEPSSEAPGQIGEGQGPGAGPDRDEAFALRRLLPERGHERVELLHEAAGSDPSVRRRRGAGAATGQADHERALRRRLREEAAQQEQGVGRLLGAARRGEAQEFGLVAAAPGQGQEAPGGVRDGQSPSAGRDEEDRRIAEGTSQRAMGGRQGVGETIQGLRAPPEEDGAIPVTGGGDGQGGMGEDHEEGEDEARHVGSFRTACSGCKGRAKPPRASDGQAGGGTGPSTVASCSTRTSSRWTSSLHLE